MRRRIVKARELKRFPPSHEWLRQQPSGWVREIMLAGEADEAREAWQLTHKTSGED